MGGASQKPKVLGRVTALILDSATKKPIDYASVSLSVASTKKSVTGGVTDDKGKVVLQNVAPDTYVMAVGFLGYKTKFVNVKTTPEKPDANVGTVYVSPTESNLKEVSVVGQKALIENKVDKMVYNAENDITNAGGDATDVMRKVPMLSVDMNGNVQLRGSAVRVLINGKPSGTMANSVADALKMIPAEQIKSVEVITSPSAKYDAEGSGGIINIITKKTTSEGTSGSVNASAGTRSNNGAFNLNVKTGRLALTTSLGLNHAYPQNSQVDNFNSSTNAAGVTRTVIQDGFSKWSRVGYNGSAGLDYDLNGYNNFSTNVKLNSFSNGGPGETNITTNNGTADFLSRNIRDMDMGFKNMDWTADYRKTSKLEGEEFTISGQLSTGRNTSDFSNRFISTGVPDVFIANSNTGKNNEYTLQSDYVYPFNKTTILEVGVKGIARQIISDYDVSAQDFDYDQNVASAYGVMGFKLTKKITAKAGLRAEYTDISGLAGNELEIKNDYFNLFPSAILSKTINPMTTLKLAYNKRVQRPSLAYLNPFLNETNPYSVMQGNPDLNPELSHNVELGYSTFIKGSMINASLFYRRTQNVIENFNREYVSPTTNVEGVLTSYSNIGTTQSYGANVFASYNPTPKWTLMTNVGVNTYEIENKDPNRKGMNEGTYLNYNLFLRSATAFKGGWNLELFGVVNSPRYTFQSKTDPMFFYGGGVKKDLMKKQASLGLNLLNPFNRDLHIKTVSEAGGSLGQTTNIYYPLRQISLNFSYKFGKLKFTEKKKIKNDDVKQEQQQGGGMGGMGQGK
ncbi:MAG: TonB-dependent receptor [Pedobacter sp.]|nr:MAG: TonB-dependent receptor [Pedobacter sp.]